MEKAAAGMDQRPHEELEDGDEAAWQDGGDPFSCPENPPNSWLEVGGSRGG